MEDRVRLLLVDDEERTAELVAERLETEREGFSVTTRTDPSAVPGVLTEEDVDCVVSDYRMPETNGLELLEQVREEWPDLPFVLFTGRGTESVASEAIAAGATDYVPKSLDPDSIAVLANRIANAVEQYRDRKRAERVRRRYATMLAGSRGLITVVDADWVVQYQSPSIEQVLGLERGTVEGSDVLEHVHSSDREAVAEVLEELVDGDASAPTVEFRLRNAEGEWRWLEAVGADATDSPVGGYVFNAIDVTDRKRQQAELERKERAMDEASVGITISDPDEPDNPMVYANEGFSEVTGYDVADVLGRNCRFLQGPATDEERVARVREAIDAGEECTVELRNYREDGTEFWNRLRVSPIRDDDGTVTNFVGFQQDVTERKRYERTLSELHGVSRELLAAGDADEVATVATGAANELLEVDAAAVFFYDEAENALVPSAHVEGTEDVVDGVPSFEAGEGIAWDVFVDGELRVYDDVGEAEDAYNPETSIGSELLLPLGDHGVFLFGRTDPESFGKRFLELADVLAANAEAALDRTERERRIRQRERELDRRNERLRKLDEVNERVRTICHEIVGANDPAEVYETVCSKLSQVDRFRFVCVATEGPGGTRVEFEERGGVETGYIEEIDHGIGGKEPTVRAVRTGEVAAVDEVAADLRAGDWRRVALVRDYRSVVSLPIADAGVQYGALTVYSDVTGFDDETLSVLRSLARTVGAALRSIDRRQANFGDELVELSFTLPGAGSPLIAVGREVGADLFVDDAVTGSDGTRAFATARADGEEIRTAVAEVPGMESPRVLRSSGETTTFEVTLSERPMLDVVLEHGGSFEGLSVSGDEARLDVSFVGSTDVGGFVDLFCRRFPGSELRARRSVDGTDRPRGDDELTERQLEALATAYYSGYYDWPREITSESVASSMGITKPTFLEHLRQAEASAISRFLESGPDEYGRHSPD